MMTIIFDIVLCLDSVTNRVDERANVAFSVNVGHFSYIFYVKKVNVAIKHSKIQDSFYLELFSVFDSFSKAAAVVMPSV